MENKFNYNNIPEELKNLKQWVCWNETKIPKNPFTGGNAMSNNNSTWGTYEDAIKAVDKFKFSGIGFMFSPPYFGVDLDKCVDETDFIDEFIDTLGSYAEFSKSGNGIHIICKGEIPPGGNRKGNVEMYSKGRFFIMTGNYYKELKPIIDCTETIKILHIKYINEPKSEALPIKIEKVNMDDGELINIARQSKNGAVFQLLYDGVWDGLYTSQSEADMAFCNMLAFWTQKDYQQMDRIFRTSKLLRKKWDEKRGTLTYAQTTIEKAIANCNDVYNPRDDISKIVGKTRFNKTKTIYEEFDLTDTGNGKRFASYFKDNVRFSRNRKKWFFWDGKVWREDGTNEIRRLADECIERMKKQAFSYDDEDKKEQLLKWAIRTSSNKQKTNMISEAEHLMGIAIDINYFDIQKDLLNMDNGIVNLRNGELIPHDPSYNMSKIGYSSYSLDNKKPTRWLQFLDEITNNDKELQLYLQKAVGYSLTGSIKEQCLFFLYGNGCNGKSTFIDVVTTIMGSYAMNVQAESIMKTNAQKSANSDIARLKGARLITVSEPEEGTRINESLIKQLTGGDTITARFLFGEEFEFIPQFKMWIPTNHKPVIRGTDDGIWRRIVLIPFTVKIPENKIDKGLSNKLRQELPYITKWAVEGCVLWQKEGLKQPASISTPTKEYREEADVLKKFIDDCIEEVENEKIKANVLYQVYEKWANENNEYCHTNTRFGRDFSLRFREKVRYGDGVFYKNCKFTDYALLNYIQEKNPYKPKEYNQKDE